MEPIIKRLSSKKLLGMRIEMCLSNNKTAELWQGFMPRRSEITNRIGNDLYSLQVYDDSYSFNSFNPHAMFEKWAAVEVSDFKTIPNEMEAFTLLDGLYAVFYYKGLSTDTKIFQYIYGEWLPKSEYVIDNRPHFEILGEKYKNNDPDSEEEIWVPIKRIMK
jgi:AraC family transcriptional regulator